MSNLRAITCSKERSQKGRYAEVCMQELRIISQSLGNNPLLEQTE